MPKVIQMSHMILRRLSVQECEKFLLIFFVINTFLSPNHIMSKNLYNVTAFPQLGLPRRVMWIDCPSKLKRCISKTFFVSETLFGVNRSYKTPTEKKKAFREYSRWCFHFSCVCVFSLRMPKGAPNQMPSCRHSHSFLASIAVMRIPGAKYDFHQQEWTYF